MMTCGRAIVSLVLLFGWQVSGDVYYSSYYGTELTNDDVSAYTKNGTLANCTKAISQCDASESRRIDGTCNNLAHPYNGATRTPYYRLLEANYNRTSDTVFDPRLSACTGGALAGARDLRRTLLADGRVEDDILTISATHFAVFFAGDITSSQDTVNFVAWRPYCCKPEGVNDPLCAPNPVPEDDYVHRFSGITCLNMTRPLTYQTSGCLAANTTPLRIVEATPTFDLSPIYGDIVEPARRTFINGTLRTETIDNIIFPPTTGVNIALSETFMGTILFWRFHNHIAQKLAEINPCWSDDEIFATAREINIACGSQILYYELMGTLMGTNNLIVDKVLLNSTSGSYGFRDIYDESKVPRISMEFPAVLRWMHTMQAGLLKFYDSNGVYLNDSFPMVNVSSNNAFLKQEGRMAYIMQGCGRQASGKVNDHTVDSDLLNFGLGRFQKSMDILTNDLAKTRHFGIPSYVHYRSYCFGDKITSFDQLEGIISLERIEALKSKYSCVEDIDLMAGVWMEELMENAFVPPTFYCIVKEQLLHTIQSDRHWYERSQRPNAFSKAQLREIRKISSSRILCDVGDSITEIQPRSFELPREGNKIVSCDAIQNIDYTKWVDCCSS